MPDKKINKSLKVLVFLTSLLTFFSLWVYLSDKIDGFYVKNILKIEKTNKIEKKNNFFKNERKDDLDLENFWVVYDLIKTKYYWIDWLDKKDLVDWAIWWLIDSLWDKHSEFMTTEETKKFNEVLSWDFEWIWAVVRKTPIWVEIERIIKWSPAKKHWLKEKDIILKANGEELQELNLYDAVDKIKWPAWTKVVLTILREGEADFLDIEVIRAKIKIPSIDSKIFEEENIWYIEINMFGQNTSKDFERELSKMKEVPWLIIDLRNNWWWYLQSAVDILWNFIEEWEILVTTKYRDSFFDIAYKSVNFGEKYNKEVVVIINWSSASASEITAWALRDYNKAIIVWEKSYGKGSVQQPFDLDDKSMVKLTIAKWFTPKGVNIDEEGITPDIEVNFEKEDFENDYDRQLEEAKKILIDFIEIWSLWVTVDKYNNK